VQHLSQVDTKSDDRARVVACGTTCRLPIFEIGVAEKDLGGHAKRKFWRIGLPPTLDRIARLIRRTMQVVALNYASSFFMSITPLAELIAFVAIPAYQQIVFVAGADLACQIFFVTVVGKFASWAVQTELVQGMLKNGTETLARERERQRHASSRNEL
jgi:hypothetical protein